MPRPILPRTSVLLLLLCAQPLGARAQVSPRDPELPLPPAVRELRAANHDAFRFSRAWKNVAVRARRAREEARANARTALTPWQSSGPQQRTAHGGPAQGGAAQGGATQQGAAQGGAVEQGATQQGAYPASTSQANAAQAVSGSFKVPVFAVKFANTSGEPWPPLQLEQELFGGGVVVQTLRNYYREVSGGRVDIGGQVFGWQQLSKDDTWYEGTSNGQNPGDAHVGELIRETLDDFDASIDFGQFDNDGPDGIPNSGDDDGYVDFVAFVHPEVGAECGGPTDSFWSNRWRYSVWPASGGVPYQTQDTSAGGGLILIDDYVLQPGLACDGVSMIQIGVFCHEFGHAFGLPDLYDVNGGGAKGLGHWCLMASGNWNLPAQPAHMSAWSKQQLGWVNTVELDWRGTTVDVAPVVLAQTIYALDFADDRWRRRDDCPLDAAWSMEVGLDQAESAARGWPASRGYGNLWRETVSHDFHYDGVGPVRFGYDYLVDSEGGFDFAFVLLEVDGIEQNLAVFNGNESGTRSHDLSALLGAGPTDYRISFRFTSDGETSNEDGGFASSCAPFIVDDVWLSGGGEEHFADFETHRAGWYCPDDEKNNPRSEKWLMENRQPIGYDQNLHGTGLMIYHVDQEVIESSNGNTGGPNDLSARGVVIMEADGRQDLLAKGGENRGDDGDPWPGVTSSTLFDSTSVPASVDNDGELTRITVSGIESIGQSIRATFWGGNPPPTLTGLSPALARRDSIASWNLQLLGAQNLRHGATLKLVRSGFSALEAENFDWIDSDAATARFDLQDAMSGLYDVVLENPDGQTAVLSDGFEIVSSVTDNGDRPLPARFALEQNHPNPFNPTTTIRFQIPRDGLVQLIIYDARGRRIRGLHEGPLGAGFHELRWHGDDDRGRPVASGLYFYRLRAGGFSAQKKMLLAR